MWYAAALHSCASDRWCLLAIWLPTLARALPKPLSCTLQWRENMQIAFELLKTEQARSPHCLVNHVVLGKRADILNFCWDLLESSLSQRWDQEMGCVCVCVCVACGSGAGPGGGAYVEVFNQIELHPAEIGLGARSGPRSSVCHPV